MEYIENDTTLYASYPILVKDEKYRCLTDLIFKNNQETLFNQDLKKYKSESLNIKDIILSFRISKQEHDNLSHTMKRNKGRLFINSPNLISVYRFYRAIGKLRWLLKNKTVFLS